jgi:hypothetical protein
MEKIGTGEGAQAYGHGLYFAENPRTAHNYRQVLSEQRGIEIPTKEASEELAPYLNFAQAAVHEAGLHAQSAGYKLEETVARLRKHASELPKNAEVPQYYAKAYNKIADMLEAGKLKPGDSGALYHVDLPDEHIEKMLDWDRPLSEQPESVKTAVRSAFEKRGIPGYLDKNPTGEELYTWLAGTSPKDAGEGKAYATKMLGELGIPGIKYLDQGSRTTGKGTRNFVVFDENIVKVLKRE